MSLVGDQSAYTLPMRTIINQDNDTNANHESNVKVLSNVNIPFVNQANVNIAWQEASRLVNLSDPQASAVVQRVINGPHCWLAANLELVNPL